MDGVAEKAIRDVASMSTHHPITQIFTRKRNLVVFLVSYTNTGY